MRTETLISQLRFMVLMLLALNGMISCERGVKTLAGAMMKKELALRLIPREPPAQVE